MADLESCRLGQTILGGLDPCEVPYSGSGLGYVNGTGVVYQSEGNYCADLRTDCVTLTAAEAANLLKLDPFYGSGQTPSCPPTERYRWGAPHTA